MDIFFSNLSFLFFFLPQLKTARYTRKYYLKGPLNPKQPNNKIHETSLHMNRRNKTESAILVSVMFSLLQKGLISELILSSLQLVLCRVAAVKRLPVHHHSAYYICSLFWSFGIIGLILSQFCKIVPLKPVLGGVGSVAPLHYLT